MISAKNSSRTDCLFRIVLLDSVDYGMLRRHSRHSVEIKL
jgi:hypothetical protein